MLTRHTVTSVQPTPQELASEFWDMSANEQAKFFNSLAKLTEKEPFAFQLQYVSESPKITFEGLAVMEKIGLYGRRNV